MDGAIGLQQQVYFADFLCGHLTLVRHTVSAIHTTWIAMYSLLRCLLTLLLTACPVCWVCCSLVFCCLLLVLAFFSFWLSPFPGAHVSPDCQYCLQHSLLSRSLSFTLLLTHYSFKPKLNTHSHDVTPAWSIYQSPTFSEFMSNCFRQAVHWWQQW